MKKREPLNDKLIMHINKGTKYQAMILANKEEMSLSQLVRKLLVEYIDKNSSSKKRQIKRVSKSAN